jgi:hypothetical protein
MAVRFIERVDSKVKITKGNPSKYGDEDYMHETHLP